MNRPTGMTILIVVSIVLAIVAGYGAYCATNAVLTIEKEKLKQQEHLADLEYKYLHAILAKRQMDIEISLAEDEADLMLMQKRIVANIVESPVKCLADNIYYEAGFESVEGQLAVAQVTLNRAHDKTSDICHEVYFKKVNPYTHKKEAAFSWTLGSRWRPHGINHMVYRECTQLAKAVLTKHLRSDIIDSSVVMYHATYIKPRWANNYTMVAKIGQHIFYR